MKHTRRPAWAILFILLLGGLYTSCKDKIDEYYATPEWLKGSIYEVLEKRGDYSIFLKGIELANMKPILNGKSILTVMAPTDSAFTVYLNEKWGGKKIEELPASEITKLIGFHVLYYAFDKEKLTNFRPKEGDGASEEEKRKNAGLYYKFRSKSLDEITIEEDTSGMDVSVYHLERFLPVFSYQMFQTKQIDPKYNYEYFFPKTTWSDNYGFNVSNASVDEYAVIADNGYVYLVNKVLRPLETIYTELASNEDYSDFLELYNAYEYYQLDDNLTLEYGDGTDLYQHYHSSPLANIATEWPVTDYRMVSELASTSYSVFAFNNAAMRTFFNDYWKVGGYDSLGAVSKTSIEYLLFNSVYTSSIVFPEEIKNGLVENSYGTIINFDVDAIPESNRIICVNGALYESEELTPPAMFGSVTGPAFQYKKFSYFLDMLSVSDLVLTLSSNETSFIMLYPSDDLMNRYGITRVNDDLFKGSQRISGGAQQNYTYAHVVNVEVTPGSDGTLPATGYHVYRNLSPSNILYWFMRDGKVTNCIKHNELLYIPNITEEDVYSDISELTFRDGWTNGKSYEYNNTTQPYVFEGDQSNAIYGSFVPMMINNRSQASAVFHGFVQLLEIADMIDIESQSITVMVESSLMFVPTTDAIKNGIFSGKVPGISTSSTSIDAPDFFANCTVSNPDTLQYYMLQYFMPLSTAIISNYPFVGWEETTTGGIPTLQSYDVELEDGKVETKTTKMNVSDANDKLSIQILDNDGNATGKWIDVIDDYHYFPFVFDDGCVHFINDVL